MLFITCPKCLMKVQYNFQYNLIYSSDKLCKWLIPASKCPIINPVPIINPIPMLPIYLNIDPKNKIILFK